MSSSLSGDRREPSTADRYRVMQIAREMVENALDQTELKVAILMAADEITVDTTKMDRDAIEKHLAEIALDLVQTHQVPKKTAIPTLSMEEIKDMLKPKTDFAVGHGGIL